MANVVFVAPYVLDATTRFVTAVVQVPDTRVGLISTDPVERFPDAVRDRLAGHWRLEDCLDADQLVTGVARLGEHLGGVDRLLAILENLQVPLAEVRERLGIPGMGVQVAHRFRDKAAMKTVFEEAGIPCARHRRATTGADVEAFARECGLPFVVKPLAGAGARGTFRIEDREQLDRWLSTARLSDDDPAMLEEFLVGAEHSFDSALIDGRLVWHSIGRYLPTPLSVLENPWIQWCVLLPRHIDHEPFLEITDVGVRAVRALGLHTGFSHMEWFRRPDGSVAVSEVGARPPGAQFTTLMSWAHDTDLYATWARFAVHDVFDPPPRQYAVGAAYLRAQGAGRTIRAVHGLERVSESTRSLVVEAKVPEPGRPVADTYEGDGHVVVRHPDTERVEAALAELITTIHVETA
jgi:formate-dependent phosphoribosylglycinamide formyltransferase (GAR transformylase)